MLSDLLMQKRGIALKAVARELMDFHKGDKVPTVTHLSEKLGVSRGNIQYALENLRSLEAVELLPRGHLGTFLQQADYIKLAQICGTRNIVGVMPLPYSKQYEGLATALFTAINTGELEGNIAFMRGSGNRLKQLLNKRYDFAVMSSLAYEQYKEQGNAIMQVAELASGSFVNRHVVMVRAGFNGEWKGLKVGIDYSSIDQRMLTVAYFKDKDIDFVPLMYSQILQFLLDGVIDAGVWNIDDVGLNTKNIAILELDNIDIEQKNTRASIVCCSDDSVSIRLLKELLDYEKISAEQQQVVRGEIVPRY